MYVPLMYKKNSAPPPLPPPPPPQLSSECMHCLFKAIDFTGYINDIQEADNILGMFRTRASLHQKAYRHKTVIAVEHKLATVSLS